MSATTGVPASITTPDTVRSRLGTLEFRDGAPSEETAALVYDNLDFLHGVQAFLRGIPYTMRGSDGAYLDGGRNYRLTLPADIPESRFWSLILYDRQTRSMLQTDQHLPRLGSQSGTVETIPDGSTDIYFGPTAPDGKTTTGYRRPRQGLVADPAALKPAPAVLRQDVAAE